MSTRVPEPLDAAEYARQVRQALGDLPAAVYEDVLEDLDEHLVEVAADGDGPLEAKLGAPTVYAQELHRAAGLPTSAGVRTPSTVDRLGAAGRRLGRHDAAKAVLAFLPELRPAWWVLRAWLAAAALSYLSGSPSVVLPFGVLLGIPVVAAAIVLSVRLGRWTQRRPLTDPRQWLVTVGGNVALALFALFVLVTVQQQNTGTVYAGPSSPDYGYGYGHDYGYDYGEGRTLARQDGTPITNIYPYSSSGEPLSGVLLYDQDGQALDNLFIARPDGSAIERVVPSGSAPPPANAYPQRQRFPADNGQEPVTSAPPDPAPAPSITRDVPGRGIAPAPTAGPDPTITASPTTSSPAVTPSPSPAG